MADEKIGYFNTERFDKEVSAIASAAKYSFLGDYSKLYETWKRTRNVTRIFREEIAKKNVNRVADIGCGNGLHIFLLNSLSGTKKPMHFHGIDIDPYEIRYAEEVRKKLKLDNVTFSVGDAEDVKLPEEYFDIALSSEVIEHVADPHKCLDGIRRMLKPGGLAIITTPNEDSLFHKLRSFFRPHQENEKEIDDRNAEECHGRYPGHISVKGPREWRAIMKASGFKIELIRGGSFLQGGHAYNVHPVLFGIGIILDTILGCINFLPDKTENVTFKLRRI